MNNLLAHHALTRVPEAEMFRDSCKLISTTLSTCGRDRTFELDELIKEIEKIEVDFCAHTLPNTQTGKQTE